MNKKLLAIGSIIACVILLVASLSPVVGYNSARSSGKDSPLFSIRTKRAINQETEDLTCNYFGKGKACTLYIPRQNNQIETALKVIDAIAKMDDETFEQFVASLINQIEMDNRFNDVNIDKIRDALYQFRDSDKIIPILNKETENKHNIQLWTYDTYWCHTCSPSCWFIEIWWFLFWAIINSIQALLLWFKNIRNAISAILPGCCETWN